MKLHSVRLLVATILLVSLNAFAETTYIRAGSLFDSQTGRVSRDRIIVVEDDRIRSIGGAEVAIPDGANVIDLSNSFVLPGVMDMHTHIVGNLDNYFFAGYFQSPHRATIGGVVNAEKTLMAGFTTIRNVGASDYADVAIRNAKAKKKGAKNAG